jgi:hypothetical protein
MQSMADKLISFYRSIKPPLDLPKGIEVLYPQKDPEVISIVEQFFQKYFNNDHPRNLMLGINPGRYGAGMTGVNFTAPKQLKEYCGIDHHFKNSSELSAEFIYEMITAYGGPERFYHNWFIGSVCPLGFVQRATAGNMKKSKIIPRPSIGDDTVAVLPGKKKEKNLNYYDDKVLLKSVTPFIIDCINQQIAIGFNMERCLCIGEKNFKFLCGLNNEHNWFKEIVPLPHPRFILQYRRKLKDKYIHQYLSALGSGLRTFP